MNRKTITLIILLVALAIGFLFLPIKAWVIALQLWIKGLGFVGPFVFILLYAVTTIFLIPGSALTLAAGAIFGLWAGAVTVIVGSNLGALAAFLLARTKLREKVQLWAQANPKFSALDKAIGANGFKMVLLTRLSPAFPFTLLNYFLGLTSVRIGPYMLANFLGMLPATFLYVYLGSLAGDTLTVATNQGTNKFQLALKIIGLIATLLVVILVTRIARNAIKDAEHQPTVNASISSEGEQA